MVVVILLGGEIAKAACGVPTMTCSGGKYTGHCVISGTGLLQLDSTLKAESLTIAQEQNADCGIVLSLAQGSNTIGKLIVSREGGSANDGSPLRLTMIRATQGTTLTIEVVTKNAGIKSPLGIYLQEADFVLKNQDGTSGVNITLANGQVINKPNESSAISGGGTGGSGNQGGEFTPPENATPEQLLQSVIKYAQALNEQLHLESTNTLILYNILNNYDGTYINYDYGLGHQVGIGAFNNGGFARYYNYNSKNGFDIGAKLKIAVANRLYLRGVAYYTYFGSSTLASHSLVFGLGVLKNFDFALGSSGNVFWVLNPSANLYYAATLKGTYMPANHLGFGNVALDTGLRIKNTSLLLRGSAGGVLNSLKSIGIDLGNGANYKNTTFFNNAIYSASFVFSQKFPLQNHNGRFYLNADIGGVFVDRVLDSITNKPYILKAGMLLGYEFGGDKGANKSGSKKANKGTSRYKKLYKRKKRKTRKSNALPKNAKSDTIEQKNTTQPKKITTKKSRKKGRKKRKTKK